jgi:hypothetical protein
MIQLTGPTTSNRRLQADETKKSHPPFVVKKADCGRAFARSHFFNSWPVIVATVFHSGFEGV